MIWEGGGRGRFAKPLINGLCLYGLRRWPLSPYKAYCLFCILHISNKISSRPLFCNSNRLWRRTTIGRYKAAIKPSGVLKGSIRETVLVIVAGIDCLLVMIWDSRTWYTNFGTVYKCNNGVTRDPFSASVSHRALLLTAWIQNVVWVTIRSFPRNVRSSSKRLLKVVRRIQKKFYLRSIHLVGVGECWKNAHIAVNGRTIYSLLHIISNNSNLLHRIVMLLRLKRKSMRHWR